MLAYDEDNLVLPKANNQACLPLSYEAAVQSIDALKQDLMAKSEASLLFGNERNDAFAGVLGNVEQTFVGEFLYPTVEERAANLLYLIIKDHPFSDGNKRIGCLIFLIYLRLQNVALKLNDSGLVALALLIAESDPKQKDLLIKLVVNLLQN